MNYINPQYKLEVLAEYTITDQGLLLVGQLIPNLLSLPHFFLRWDEKADHLNVDMKPENEHWRDEINGYKGHRPQKSDQHPGRAFYLIIKIPSMDIINAVISFNLAKAMGLKESIGVKAISSVDRQL